MLLNIHPRQKDIWISVTTYGGMVRLAVRDEGPGLTETDLSKLFGEFERLSAQPTGGETTTGLGLSHCEAFGGVARGACVG